MNRRSVIIGIIIALLLVVGGVVWAASRQERPAPKEYSDDAVLSAITRDIPLLLSHEKPVIEIVSLKRLNDVWYVAVIKSVNEEKMTVPVKIVLKDQGEPSHDLKVMLGPDIFQSESQTAGHGLPDSVILELLKS